MRNITSLAYFSLYVKCIFVFLSEQCHRDRLHTKFGYAIISILTKIWVNVMKQLDHYETISKIISCQSELLLCLCGLTSENLGLILRTADVFAVKKIFYYGDSLKNEGKIKRVSRGASTPIEFIDSLQCIEDIRHEGYTLTALEITDESFPLRTFVFPSKTCLIVGNERNGVPQELLDIADNACYIEMYGKNISSLNVSVSTAIAINRYMELQQVIHAQNFE